jgi:hypothetical protein
MNLLGENIIGSLESNIFGCWLLGGTALGINITLLLLPVFYPKVPSFGPPFPFTPQSFWPLALLRLIVSYYL